MIHDKHRTWSRVKPRNPIKRIKMEQMKYEYQIVSIVGLYDIEKKLETLSDEGWELVSVVEDRHYFKRPKPLEGKTGPEVL